MSNSRPERVTLKMIAQATGYTTNTVFHALKKADGIITAPNQQDLRDILKRPIIYDAIFAFSEFIAREIMVLFMEAGKPQDIPIIGFDDIQSNLWIPIPFATIGADKQLEAQKAVSSLTTKIFLDSQSIPMLYYFLFDILLYYFHPCSLFFKYSCAASN